MFTAGPVERARGWGSRKPQLTCPCLDSGRSTLKRHIRQRLGCRAGPSPGHSTNPFWPRCWPFCSGSGDAGQSGTAPTYLASGFCCAHLYRLRLVRHRIAATRPLLRVKAGSGRAAGQILFFWPGHGLWNSSGCRPASSPRWRGFLKLTPQGSGRRGRAELAIADVARQFTAERPCSAGRSGRWRACAGLCVARPW